MTKSALARTEFKDNSNVCDCSVIYCVVTIAGNVQNKLLTCEKIAQVLYFVQFFPKHHFYCFVGTDHPTDLLLPRC